MLPYSKTCPANSAAIDLRAMTGLSSSDQEVVDNCIVSLGQYGADVVNVRVSSLGWSVVPQ